MDDYYDDYEYDCGCDNDSSIDKSLISAASQEIIDRYGSAVKEHFVAYTGRDNQSGVVYNRGLKQISQSKINPDYRESNIKQQAGFSAERKYVARQNAEKIISKSSDRYCRTDDIGRVNDPLYDHVLRDKYGNIIPGTGEQMKIVGNNPKACLSLLESEKYQKYLDADATLTIPSDFYKGVLIETDVRIQKLQTQLEKARINGNYDLASTLSSRIAKLRKIKISLKNSGISTKESVLARLHPAESTADDVVRLAHRAGVESIKNGVTISGGISIIKNIVAVTKGDKDVTKAAQDIVKDTGTGAVTSYVTAFSGSIIKGSLQNSNKEALRSISKTSLPSIVATSALDISKTFKKYLSGEISGGECLSQIGEKGTCNISSAIFATAGQSLIPVPVVGAMVGSMIGYALSSTFYQSLTTTLKEAEYAREERIVVEKQCEDSIALISSYRKQMDMYAQKYFNYYRGILDNAFREMDNAIISQDADAYVRGSDKIMEAFGGKLPFSSFDEFDRLAKTHTKIII